MSGVTADHLFRAVDPQELLDRICFECKKHYDSATLMCMCVAAQLFLHDDLWTYVFFISTFIVSLQTKPHVILSPCLSYKVVYACFIFLKLQVVDVDLFNTGS